jgi:nucleoside-diphosphate-sugar epimerase
MIFLITGGCGFLGSNLASEVIKRGHKLVVLVLSSEASHVLPNHLLPVQVIVTVLTVLFIT